MQLKSDIKEFIIDNFLYGQDDGTLGDDVSFLSTGIIDSTGVLELVSYIEEEYGISVEDEELIPENLDSIQKISDFIQRKSCNSK